jgi:hypothetical protein
MLIKTITKENKIPQTELYALKSFEERIVSSSQRTRKAAPERK